jgi:hypothetical protein
MPDYSEAYRKTAEFNERTYRKVCAGTTQPSPVSGPRSR